MQSKLVGIVLAISVATTLAASLVNCTDQDGIPDYYLPVPSHSKIGRDMTYEMLIEDTRPAGLEPHKMLEEFDQLIASNTDRKREFYTVMRKLADPADDYDDEDEDEYEISTWKLNNYIFEILTLFKEHPDKPVFANYVNYVKAYGPAKYNEYLKHSQRQFDLVYLEYGEKVAFDNFYIKYFGLKPRLLQPMDEELYTRAKSVCLSSDDLKVKQTLEVAKQYRHEKSASPSDIVKTFVGDMCKIFEKHDLQHALEIVHLGEALGAKLPSEFPVEYLKLIEYNRICIAWKKGDKTRPGLQEAPAADKKWFKLF